jgi:hypothetical protein
VNCGEYEDIGPFRFECNIEHHGSRDTLFSLHGGKQTHHCLTRGDVGDVDVTFWTWVEPVTDWERRHLHTDHPSQLHDRPGVEH